MKRSSLTFRLTLGLSLPFAAVLPGCAGVDDDLQAELDPEGNEPIGEAAQAVSSEVYEWGTWATPTQGQLGSIQTSMTADQCAASCDADAQCVGFHTYTDWNACQLYGAEAATAGRAGPWSNVVMYWKKQAIDANDYSGGPWEASSGGQIGGVRTGYRPHQCAALCDGTPDCIGFHTYTDWDACQLYGSEAETAPRNGPWSNVAVHWKNTRYKHLPVDFHVFTTAQGGNEIYSEEIARAVLVAASKRMTTDLATPESPDVVFTLGSYETVVDPAVYNSIYMQEVLDACGSRAVPGRVQVCVGGPNANDADGLAYVYMNIQPYFALRSGVISTGSSSEVSLVADDFIHELAHNLGFPERDATPYSEYPWGSDWTFNSWGAREVFERFSDWATVRRAGVDSDLKSTMFDCGLDWSVPTSGAFPAPTFFAASADECAALCQERPDCASFWVINGSECQLYDATSVGSASGGHWTNLEMCWKKPPGPNLALGHPASQSGTSGDAGAGRAVDGVTNGLFNRGSVTRTGVKAQPWWKVDLESAQWVDSVVLHNRTDCCSDRLSNFTVLTSVNGTSWTQFPYPGTAPDRLELPIGKNARYVKVRLEGTNTLSLAEVQVF